MPTNTPAEDFAKRYGLDSISESVRRLGQLVSNPDATTEEIAKVIGKDQDFTARLLRAANPKAETEADYVATTVEEALQRTGIGSVLLVAMHDPLMGAVQKTFRTMLGAELKRLTAAMPFEGEHILCEIAFTGKATGAAALRLTTSTALQIAARVLGMPSADLDDPATIDDVIGELSNMVVGNFKSNLCDAGLNCKLSPPVIRRTSDFKLRSITGSLAERIGFHAPQIELFVDLLVNPWGD
jgi:chemotaxis protein CheX